jgi:hypothetical protein
MTTHHRVSAVSATDTQTSADTTQLPAVHETADEPTPRDTRPLPVVADSVEPDADEDATVLQESVRPPVSSRPRKTTLAVAIPKPAPTTEPPAGAEPARAAEPPAAPAGQDGIVDEVDEWAAADQPTVYLSPRPRRRPRPEYLETGEAPSWPPRPASAGSVPVQPQAPAPRQVPPPSMPRPDVYSRPVAPEAGGTGRLASPSGRLMPQTPPVGVPRAALPNPRMQRFQELRRQRTQLESGLRDPSAPRPVAEVVRQWWADLRPGLEGALRYQREARASGIHPIPAHEQAPFARLGDAFGRIAASARELTERAQAAAAPTLKRWHAQAEQAAQAIVGRIEGSPIQQQAPLLGPGRIAVFFRQGVTVGQAQKLLSASQARPIRLIPRKHGFLALVPPGAEAEVAGRLRVHPYVRDVLFLQYDEDGQPLDPR